ncbi:myo-inositol-1(or 4)-monophosphatase [Litorimonas taeanensis]|uniref:Myo-inositol-1(Or 4)-monophosphatase n=1 Tax=Litorimonas taeanensis TaxID=568099 RepID=A0A420WE41_9PROT|nr:inositol monophosphatase family protein [Litorimonas taeanensis]RKQ69289.1 myo-inositol-1(or 4)-monophosphatase [Litorimonas taeanensis]
MTVPNPLCHPLSEERALLEQVVKQAGQIAKDAFHANNSKVWDKEKGHPVTDADIAVNDFLYKALMAARPDYGWLSEETKDDHSRHACPRSFVVDPIDGTRAFIDRTPNFVVSVAIIEDGKPMAGAIFNPLKGELFSAHLGGGAKRNGTTISCSTRSALEGAEMIGYPRKFRRMGFPPMQVRIANSMAYRMVLVACGEADCTVAFTPKSDWDIAAACLIATESGALVTNLRGATPQFDKDSTSGFGVICAGPSLQALLLERVKPLVAEFDASVNKTEDFKHMGTKMADREMKSIQLLHIVIGGELVDPMRTEFKDLKKVDFVGAFPTFEAAQAAWKAAAQRTVDNAHTRYFILHAHDLLDPDGDGIIG